MRIAVVGCGAMGSVYAGRLASAGHDVLAVDRWAAHMSAIAENGLLVSGPDGEFRVPVRAHTSAPDDPVDLVVLAVKAADVETAAAGARPLIGPDTVVLTIQNGFGSADVVAAELGGDRLAVGVASGFGASVKGPGNVHHNAMRALRFGGYGALDRTEVERIAAAWRLGGFDARAVTDIAAMQWEKLICNVAYSAPCALTGLTVGEVMDDAHMGPVSRAAATEAWDTARALGVAVPAPDPVELVRDFGARMPAAKPSALLDHEARRVSEIMFINGAVPREAAKAGREAPVNATLTALVRARETAWRDDPPP
ncbi:2-dehydropantoate 2-reductase [Actinomadura sp. KC216]|uniref:ketopantoate reductase family protein n=1 Tax=Actinomadura sp. KC216 TaxID=2530370 RepID=UPI0010496B0A|nr:2-dehydropantoate 2-reductase [Actinomadura sp. KC216]TDB86108.1 2-dehydropantoate 2-reductase [Actinomadura sp. KC216]